MTTISAPKIDTRLEQLYIGIRTITPFKGMFKVADQLRRELNRWIKENSVEMTGPHFLRYHVIDMGGEMDISYGVPVEDALKGEGRVTPDVLPAGRYASLVYVGSGLAGNRALIDWVRATEGIAFDRWGSAKGDHFRSRYERYLTDPKMEHRKTKWEIEVAVKLT